MEENSLVTLQNGRFIQPCDKYTVDIAEAVLCVLRGKAREEQPYLVDVSLPTMASSWTILRSGLKFLPLKIKPRKLSFAGRTCYSKTHGVPEQLLSACYRKC